MPAHRRRLSAMCSIALVVLACSRDEGPTPFEASPEGRPSTPSGSRIESQITIFGGNPRYHTYDGAPRVLLGGAATLTPGDLAAVDRALGNGGTYGRLWHNHVAPHAWVRRSDGKYDLTRWNESYWSALKEVVAYARSKKLIVSAQLFSEPQLECCAERWGSHPFHPANNVNGLGLPSGSDAVPEFYALGNAKLKAIQEAYVERLVRELAPYGNVIFEITNEYTGPGDWEAHFIGFVQARTSAPIAVNRLGNPAGALTLAGVDQANYHNLHDGKVFATFAANYHRGKVQHYDEQALGSQSVAELQSMAWEALLGGGGINWDQSGNASQTPGISRGVATFLATHGFAPWEFVPTTLAGTGRPAMRKVTDALVVYVGGGSVSLDLSGWSGGYAVRWYDPAARTTVTKPELSGGGSRSLTPPFTPAVLHLTRSSGTYDGRLATGTLAGRILHDANGNGARDAGELYIGVPGACTNDTEVSGISVAWSGPTAGSAAPKLCSSGPYFASPAIPTGTYEARLVLPSGWVATAAATKTASVKANEQTAIWFMARASGSSTRASVSISTTGITDGATITGPTKVEAQVSSSLSVRRVDFYLDGYLVSSQSSAPYSLASSNNVTVAFDFAARGYRDGDHVLKVLAVVVQPDGSLATTTRDVPFRLSLGGGGVATSLLVGRILHDANGNGLRDAGELYIGVPGACTNDTEVSGLRVAWSGPASGSAAPDRCNVGPYFSSPAIPAGTYQARLVLPSGWVSTHSSTKTATLKAGEQTAIWFMARRSP